MNNELQKEYSIPSIIFYLEHNSEYGKVYSMDDIKKTIRRTIRLLLYGLHDFRKIYTRLSKVV